MKNTYKALLTAIALPCMSMGQVQFESAKSTLEADNKKALEELGAAREAIRQGKAPIAAELNKLKSRVENKRREIENQALLKQTKAFDLDKLEKDVDARTKSVAYVSDTLLTQFVESFGAKVQIAELPLYQSQIEETQKIVRNDDISQNDKIQAQLKMVETSLDRIQNLVGGQTFPGQAFSDGTAEDGTFGLWGPVAYFSAGSDKSGIALPGLGEGQVDLIKLKAEENAAIAATLSSGNGLTPVDPTMGDALAIAGTKETAWEHIQKGGIWIYPILGFAALSLIVAAFKAIQISRVKDPDPKVLHKCLALLKEDQDSEAFKLAQSELPAPFNALISSGISHRNDGKRLVEEVMYECVLENQPKLEKNLSFIQITAATAPLMGLLGTVTGMINTFKLITIFGTGDARSLSSGISEALVTTEFGLIVAIPSLILYALLNRRVQGILSDMDKLSAAFLNGLPKKKDGGKSNEMEDTAPASA